MSSLAPVSCPPAANGAQQNPQPNTSLSAGRGRPFLADRPSDATGGGQDAEKWAKRLDFGRLEPYIFERTFDSGFATEVPRNGQPEPAPRPRDDRKLRLILRHAALVFSGKGFQGASIRDISRSSGISLSGLYYYFESKQKLLYLIQLNAFTRILKRLEKKLSGVTDPFERLEILIANHLDYFLRHPLEMKVLSHEAEALEEPFRREVAEIKRRYYGIALGIFEELRGSGRVRRVNPRVAVLSLFGMMNWIYTWHNPKVDPRAERLAETISGIFLEGVSSNGHSGRGRAKESHRTAEPQAVPA